MPDFGRHAILLAPLSAVATLWTTGAAGAGADDPLTFRASVSWLNAAQHGTILNDSAINPDNQLLSQPRDRFVSELRPNIKFATTTVQLIARPRITQTYQVVPKPGPYAPPTGDISHELLEGFLQWTVSDSLTFAYGRQSYQWGAAEVLSPSNRLVHDTVGQHDLLYQVRGEDLARLNFSIGKQFSTVVMTRFQQNSDVPVFQAEQTYQNIGLVKSEFTWDNGANYVGAVAGGRAHSQPWAGVYGNYGLPFFDGLSLYADASAERGSAAWYPVDAPLSPLPSAPRGIAFAKTRLGDGRTYTLATAGTKYDFVNGAILRFEYVYNQAGYSRAERDQVLAVAKAPALRPSFLQNASRFLLPGLDLPGQRYAYTSVHLPDLFTVTDLTLDARVLRSLGDQSETAYANFDYKVGEAGTATAALQVAGGPKDGELRGYASPTFTVAYRQDW